MSNTSATQIAEDSFFLMDFEHTDVPGIEYIANLNDIQNFYEYTLKYAKTCGYSGGDNNADNLASFIFERSEELQTELSSLQIKNWLKKAAPTGNKAGRENVYKLCFTLNLTAQQTKEFFLKAYLECPFNYKNVNEAVYFFCMNHDIQYIEAKKILTIINDTADIENNSPTNDTQLIGKEICDLTTPEDLIKYICENRFCFSQQKTKARKKIEELKKNCYELAIEEFELYNKQNNKNKNDKKASNDTADSIDNIDTVSSVNNSDEPKNSDDYLLNLIYGYHARANENYKKVYAKSISKSSFPKKIRENFPQREQLENIKKGNASSDVIRKTLLMLQFYSYFADAFLHKAEFERGLFDEFVDETNLLLDECGYVQLYWRNPYDWMIGYCACAPNPIDELRNLISEFFLDNEDVWT